MSKRKIQPNLLNFFNKKNKSDVGDGDCEKQEELKIESTVIEEKVKNSLENTTKFDNSIQGSSNQKNELTVVPSKNIISAEISNQNILESSVPEILKDDIGYYLKRRTTTKLDDATKCHLLEKHWYPPPNYNFPCSVHTKQGKEEKRYINHNHLNKYDWLVYSEESKGLFCKYCALFVIGESGSGTRNVMPLKSLVTEPLTKFPKLLGKTGNLESHQGNKYHIYAVQDGKNFIQTFHEPEKNILNKVDTYHMEMVLENRERLVPIIESILFLARQNIPLRGHIDDGSLLEVYTESVVNEGNFRELLKFRMKSGDKQLEHQMQNSQSRATYISKTTQNELIKIAGECILEEIISRVKDAKFYSVIFDETTDLSHTSQMSLVLRYVHLNNVREDFVGFIDLHQLTYDHLSETTEPKLTGKIIGQSVLKITHELNLSHENCVAISTDGCSVMMSATCGAVKEVQSKMKNAVLCPCSNHALNLSLTKCAKVQAVRNMFGTMKEVVSFFNTSSKRSFTLKQVLGGSLLSLCETRWVERHDAILHFQDGFLSIVEALSIISVWEDTSSSSKAKSLCDAICTPEFILCMHTIAEIFSVTLPLSIKLQKEDCDKYLASTLVKNIEGVLKKKRAESEEVFNIVFKAAAKVMQELEIELKKPRLNSRMKNRTNPNVESVEDYFRITIYNPTLDEILQDLTSRFDDSVLNIFDLGVLIPKRKELNTELKQREQAALENLSHKFGPILDEFGSVSLFKSALQGEFQVWQEHWRNSLKRPTTILDSLQHCDSDIYPKIYQLLKLQAAFPVSVASAERSFSSLKRLKTWLRTRMTEERLTGLALIHVHRDINVDVNEVINKFAKKPRRLDFVL